MDSVAFSAAAVTQVLSIELQEMRRARLALVWIVFFSTGVRGGVQRYISRDGGEQAISTSPSESEWKGLHLGRRVKLSMHTF